MLLFPWLGVEPKHLMKYVNVYTNLDLDVITSTTKAQAILFSEHFVPPLADDIVKLITNNENYQEIVLHGLSVGAFLWSEAVQNMHKNDCYTSIDKRIKAQIWDCVTFQEGGALGISWALLKTNPTLIYLFSYLIRLHFMLPHNHTIQHFIRHEKKFLTSPLRAPALIFASKSDQIGGWQKSFQATDVWRSKGVDVTWKCYDDSNHVQTMRVHQSEYVKLIVQHLKNTNVLD